MNQTSPPTPNSTRLTLMRTGKNAKGEREIRLMDAIFHVLAANHIWATLLYTLILKPNTMANRNSAEVQSYARTIRKILKKKSRRKFKKIRIPIIWRPSENISLSSSLSVKKIRRFNAKLKNSANKISSIWRILRNIGKSIKNRMNFKSTKPMAPLSITSLVVFCWI